MLTAEMVHSCDDGASKRPSEGSLAGFTIPKRARIDGEISSDQHKKTVDDILEDIDVDADISALGPVKQCSFKPPVKRVARLSVDSAEQRENSHPKPAVIDPVASKTPAPTRTSFHPRTIAMPLGGSNRRNSLPPTTLQDWRKSRGVQRSDAEPSASSTSAVDSADVTLPLPLSDAPELGSSGTLQLITIIKQIVINSFI